MPKSKSFFHSLPGLLVAIFGGLGGIAGIVVAVYMTAVIEPKQPIWDYSPPPFKSMEMSPELSILVEEEFKRLPTGQVVFNPDPEMRVGIKERVEVRISKKPKEDLTRGLKGRGEPQIEKIIVGTFMKVYLTGDNFDIESHSSEEQIVPEEGFAQWLWDVIPLESGPQRLLLRVTVRIILPDLEEQYDLPVLERDIEVEINRLWTIGHFFEIHWKWLIGAIAGPIIYVLKKKR